MASHPAPNDKMPRDAAQLVLWFNGLPQPTAFLVLREAGDKALEDFTAGAEEVRFLSYPDGRGLRSESVFLTENLRGVTLEYPTIQLAAPH
jgi:hypothetical protein